MAQTRRDFLAKVSAFGSVSIGMLLGWGRSPVAQAQALPSPDQALAQLLAGNQRYRQQQPSHPHQTAERVADLAKGQQPIAVILGCADSRVTPAILFDQGLGDLFAIRVAGNIADDVVSGSIEYAVAELGTPLVMVLGHERCGAVTATIAALKAQAEASPPASAAVKVATKEQAMPGHLSALIEAIAPAVARAQAQPGDLLDNTVRANVQLTVEQLQANPFLKAAIAQNKLKIVGARYDLDQGSVELIA